MNAKFFAKSSRIRLNWTQKVTLLTWWQTNILNFQMGEEGLRDLSSSCIYNNLWAQSYILITLSEDLRFRDLIHNTAKINSDQ